MRAFLIIFLTIFILGPMIFVGVGCGTHDTLQVKHQNALGGESHYGAALDICSQKISGVWTVMLQHYDHEENVQTGVAQARSNYLSAQGAYEALAANPNVNLKDLTTAANKILQSAMTFQVQVEQTPTLQGGDTARENMRNMQEATNQIQTALDDWIRDIKNYNTYRGMSKTKFYTTVAGDFFTDFPLSLEYYEGKVGELDMNALNPQTGG